MAVVIVIFASALITFRSWRTLVIVLACSAALELALRNRGRAREIANSILSRTTPIVMVALLLLAGATDTVWVPKEKITLENGAVITGFVVAEGQFLKVLTASGRDVRVVKATDVKERADADK